MIWQCGMKGFNSLPPADIQTSFRTSRLNRSQSERAILPNVEIKGIYIPKKFVLKSNPTCTLPQSEIYLQIQEAPKQNQDGYIILAQRKRNNTTNPKDAPPECQLRGRVYSEGDRKNNNIFTRTDASFYGFVG